MATHPSHKDPIAKVALIVASLLILSAVYVLISSLIHTIKRNSTKGEIDTKTLVANNAAMVESVLKPVGEVTTSDGSGTVAAGPARSGEEVFNAVCQACHATGAAGAPKVDDKAAWEPRVAKGFDALMNTAINGKGAMPARGGQNVPDAELKAAIDFMTTKAGFHLDIPKDAPATAKPDTAKKGDTAAKPADSKAEATAKPAATPAATASTGNTEEANTADKVEAPQAPAAPATPEAPAISTEPAQAEQTTEASTEATPETATAAAPAEDTPATEAVPAPAAEAKTAAAGSNAVGEKVYKATCFACHGLGVAGAPKVGDKEAWGPRIAKGKEALYDSALKGMQTPNGVMPPKGGNFKLTDDEVKAAVDYLVSQAQ